MISRLKLAPKLIGGFGSVLVLFVCVMAIYQLSVNFTLSRFNELIEVEQAISEHSALMENAVYQARIVEGQFLRANDFADQDKMAGIVESIINQSKTIEDLARKGSEEKILSMIPEIKTLIQSYHNDFNQVVEAIRTRGVDDQSGLRGEFTAIVEKFMNDMSLLEVDAYYIEVFRLQRYQAEYMLYKTDKIANKIQASLDELKKVAENDRIDNPIREIIKELVLGIVPEYQTAFDHIRKQGKDLNLGNEDFQGMNDQLNELNEVLSAAYFNGAKGYALEIRNNEKNYLLTQDPKYVEATKHSVKVLMEEMAKAHVQKDHYEVAELNLGNYMNVFDKVVQIDQSIAQLSGQMDQSVKAISEVVKSLSDTATTASKNKRNITESQVSKRVFIAFVIGIVAILLGVGLSVGITRSITRPIVDTVAFSERMAKGDLSQKIMITRQDEVGILANALNGMVTNLNSMFSGISQGVDELTQASSSLSDISGQMKIGAEKTSEKSAVVSGASGKMNDNMEKAAATVEEASASMTYISKTTQAMNQTIGNISQSTEQARSISDSAVAKAGMTREKMAELEKAAEEIGKVTETIRDISDQTNLLALNATIESARAGEAGKGFAVVAGEIKTLAKQTADATQEISQKIEGVQTISKEAMGAILEIAGVITNINEIIVSISSSMKDQSRTTHEINSNISNTTEGIKRFNDMMVENSKMTSVIADDISEVSHAAEEMTQSSYTVNEKSRDLMQLAGRLKEMINQFTL